MQADKIKELLKIMKREDDIPKGEFRTTDLVKTGELSPTQASSLVRKLCNLPEGAPNRIVFSAKRRVKKINGDANLSNFYKFEK